MSKRNQIIIESHESIAIRSLRIKKDLSVRKLAELMNISKSRVHQMESGRENISQEYVQKFLSAINYSYESWEIKLERKRNKSYDLRKKCHDLINLISSERLEFIYDFLLIYKSMLSKNI